MKTKTLLIALALAALLTACGAPAPNTNSNSSNSVNSNANANANPINARSVAPTVDSLMDLDKQANAAYAKHDTAFFEKYLTDKFVLVEPDGVSDRATAIKGIASDPCQIKDDMKFEEPNMRMIGTDVAVLTYKTTFDGTCEMNGKQVKLPSPVRAATYWVKQGDKWMVAFHSETAIIDPKNPPPPPPKMDDKDKKAAKPADKTASNSNSAASNSNTTASKPASDANTDALMAIEKSGWDAWKARDAGKLGDLTTSDLSIVDADGSFYGNKADTIKAWTEPKCDVKSVSLSDGQSVSLTPDISILQFKGTAVGSCAGMKLGPLWSSSIYQKVGDSWKLAFQTFVPAM